MTDLYNTIDTIIDRVFSLANEKREGFITRTEVMTDFIWDFIDTVNDLRTSWNHEESDIDDSNTTTIGGEEITLPTDIKFENEKSIISIRLSGYEGLKYISHSDYYDKLAGLGRTLLDGSILLAATTIDLIDASNFASEGDGYIGGDAFSWTGKTDNQLTGVTGVLAHSSGAVVYHTGSTGNPEYYTIQNGTVRLFPAPNDDYDGLPVIIDYYKRLTHPTTEAETLPLPYVSPCIDYCLMRVSDKRGDSGNSQKNEGRFNRKIVQAVKNERTNQSPQFMAKE